MARGGGGRCVGSMPFVVMLMLAAMAQVSGGGAINQSSCGLLDGVDLGSNPSGHGFTYRRESRHRGASMVSVKSNPPAFVSCLFDEQTEGTTCNRAPFTGVPARLGRPSLAEEDEFATEAIVGDNKTSAPPPVSPGPACTEKGGAGPLSGAVNQSSCGLLDGVDLGSNPGGHDFTYRRESRHRGASIVSVKSNPPAFVSCLFDEQSEPEGTTTTRCNSAPFMGVGPSLTDQDEFATEAIQRDNETSAPPPLSPAWTEKGGAPLSGDEMLAIVAPIVAYWLTSGLYAVLGRCTVYRLHSRLEETRNLVPKIVVFRVVILQQIYQAAMSFALFKFNPETSTGPTPPFLLALQFLIAMVVLDTWQYFGHRLMHENRFLYRHVHSWHHRVVAPYAFAAQYNHPVEGLLLDAASGGLAVLVSGMSVRASAFFLAFATVKAVDDHSGMMFPWNPLHIIFGNSTAYHDVHHQLRGNRCNFAQPFFMAWDIAMGTHVPYTLQRAGHGGFEAVPATGNKRSA